MNSWTNRILWCVYLALLAVLLPHTAWAFGRFEPTGASGDVTAWAAAFAFEAAIAALTHKLSRHIENVRGRRRLFVRRYLNAYSLGLGVAMSVSALANLAHAVEFGGAMAIFARWQIPFGLYAIAFGAILPLVSLTFARVLSNVVEQDIAANPELEAANESLKALRAELRQANQRAQEAEQRFAAVGDLAVRLFAAEKRQRILAAREHWPELPPSAIAVITDTSKSYVSEVLSENAPARS